MMPRPWMFRVADALRRFGISAALNRWAGGLIGRTISDRNGLVRVDASENLCIYTWANELWRVEALHRNRYEPGTTAILKSVLQPGDVFVDIGAHVGYFSMVASSLVGPGGRVIAIEAEGRNFGVLCKNVAANRLENTLTVRAAVGDRVGTAELALSGGHSGGHTLRPEDGRHTWGSEKVAVAPLDWLLPKQTVPSVIKIDVEGAEPEVLSGMATLLVQSRPTLIVEVNPSRLSGAGTSVRELFEVLESAGYHSICAISEADESLRSLDGWRDAVDKARNGWINVLASSQNI